MKLPFKDYNYVVDTNVLITLMVYHPKDRPTYRAIWDEIEFLIEHKNISSTTVVYDEIMKYSGDNQLKKCAKSHKEHFFIPTNQEVFTPAQDVARDFPDLVDKKKLQTGEPDADPFLIALAKSESATIVTQERKDLPNRIPMVTSHCRVKSINLYEFFEERKLKFVKEH